MPTVEERIDGVDREAKAGNFEVVVKKNAETLMEIGRQFLQHEFAVRTNVPGGERAS